MMRRLLLVVTVALVMAAMMVVMAAAAVGEPQTPGTGCAKATQGTLHPMPLGVASPGVLVGCVPPGEPVGTPPF
jgi:hypothetical protein